MGLPCTHLHFSTATLSHSSHTSYTYTYRLQVTDYRLQYIRPWPCGLPQVSTVTTPRLSISRQLNFQHHHQHHQASREARRTSEGEPPGRRDRPSPSVLLCLFVSTFRRPCAPRASAIPFAMSDSIHSHDSSPKQPEKQKSRRPPSERSPVAQITASWISPWSQRRPRVGWRMPLTQHLFRYGVSATTSEGLAVCSAFNTYTSKCDGPLSTSWILNLMIDLF